MGQSTLPSYFIPLHLIALDVNNIVWNVLAIPSLGCPLPEIFSRGKVGQTFIWINHDMNTIFEDESTNLSLWSHYMRISLKRKGQPKNHLDPFYAKISLVGRYVDLSISYPSIRIKSSIKG